MVVAPQTINGVAKRPPAERRNRRWRASSRIISAARAANMTGHAYPTMTWSSLMSGKGVVSFGGNAVDDTDALYDG
jgi:hypothetical protein